MFFCARIEWFLSAILSHLRKVRLMFCRKSLKRSDTIKPKLRSVCMKTTKVTDAQSVQTPHGVNVRKLYDTEHAQVMHITLKPGESLKRHITPVDVFFYVLEGDGVVEIGDEEQTVTKDTIIDSPAKIPHCWYNRSNADFRVMVVKVPRPQNKSKVL